MLFQLVGKNTFKRSDLICIGHFLDDLSHVVVDVSGFDESESSLGSFVSSEDDISFFSGDGGIFIGLDHDGVTDKSCESIDVHSEFDFDEISFFDVDGVFLKRSEVSTDFVDGDGGREGEAFEDLLFIIDLSEFFVDLAIGPEAKFEDFATNCHLFEKASENLCMI